MDSIQGGAGADTIFAGAGDDTINWTAGSDNDALLDGEDGNDTLQTVFNTSFNDTGDGQIINVENVLLGTAATLVLDDQTEGLQLHRFSVQRHHHRRQRRGYYRRRRGQRHTDRRRQRRHFPIRRAGCQQCGCHH